MKLPAGAFHVRAAHLPDTVAVHADDTWVVIDLGSCRTKADLMRATAEGLAFGDEFGANWDALNDALTDVEASVLMFDNATSLDDDDASTLAEILADVADNGFGPRTTIVCRPGKVPRLRRLPRPR